MVVVNDYIRGRYTHDEAIRRLQPYDLDDQYTFRSKKALAYLTYERTEKVDKN